MVEVCDKVAGDKGGIPVHAEGCLQVLEEFRLPRDFDATKVTVFNTNTFLVRADALLPREIEAFLPAGFLWLGRALRLFRSRSASAKS